MNIDFLMDWSRRVASAGRITNADVVTLRRHAEDYDGEADGMAVADALFQIDAGTPEATFEWTSFFVDTLVDILVWGERPTGVVTPAMADWVLARIKLEGERAAGSHRALLVALVREAHVCDPRLAAVAFGYRNAEPQQRAPVAMTLGWLDSSGITI
ncbi:hypothetical protein [Terrarubrum flagellatum]|uniref:hypothetical protein n=1 Tax=Terrirubrum flagellatum TaxID=2895980 RepID=UPI003145672B